MVAVRVATSSDLPALAELRVEWTIEVGGRAEPRFGTRFHEWFRRESDRRVFWLASDGEDPVGMANLMLFDRMPRPDAPDGGWGYLGNMYVSASHRDRGVGRHLLIAVTAHADALGLERLVLNPSPRSISLYRRAGFVPAGTLLLRPKASSPVASL